MRANVVERQLNFVLRGVDNDKNSIFGVKNIRICG